jgi:hypothetical protein
MAKPAKTIEHPSPFERFEKLAKGLIAVPHRELLKKLDSYKRGKAKRKR